MMKARGLMTGVLLATLLGGGVAAAQPKKPPAPEMKTKDFLNAAGESDQYEIQAGRTAAAESQDAGVRAFAQQMVDDHSRTSQALMQAASASGLPPPSKVLGGDQQKMLNALQSLKGRDFDKAYVTQQVMAHTSALVTEQGYAASGPDPNVRKAAQDAVPLIQHHLQMAQQMKAQMGGS
jgi:putative membrane protein